MKITKVHAYFKIQKQSNYNEETIGFSVALEENETPESVIPLLREKAIAAIGPDASALYQKIREQSRQAYEIEERLKKLRKEWDATAEFLKAQGLNPTAPSMPQFHNLLTAVVEVESVSVQEEDYEDEEEEDDDDEQVGF